MTILVPKVHPFNFPLLWLWSYLGRVAYWRSQFIPERHLKRFHIIDPQELMTRAEWLETEEKAQSLWSESALRWNEDFKLNLRVSGALTDFTVAWFQWLAIEVRDYVVFCDCANRWANKSTTRISYSFILGTPVSTWFKRWNIKFPDSRLKTLPFSQWPDRLLYWFTACWSLRKVLFSSSSSASSRDLNLKELSHVWTGVGPREMASQPGRLDFSFLTKRGVFQRSTCLYVLPEKPSTTVTEYLAKEEIAWIADQPFVYLFSRSERIRIRFDALYATILACFSPRNRLQLPVLLHYALRGLPWIYLKRASSLSTYICSISSFFPARPEVSTLNSIGVRTINWTYSSNDFLFLPTTAAISHRITHFSIPVTKEVWVWNPLQTRIQKHRRPAFLANSVIDKWTGPVMCGDSRLLYNEPMKVRAAHGIGTQSTGQQMRYLSIFDIAVPSRTLMRQGAVGPDWLTHDNLEHFYSDLCAILEEHGNLCLLLKAKRALADVSREYTPTMLKMIDAKGEYIRSGKVIFLDHDIDPYLPIAAADYSIGLPFSSPVFAAISSNHAGRFYDPDGSCGFVIPEELEALIIRGKANLRGEISSWFADPVEYLKKQNAIPNSELWKGQERDPIVVFANLLEKPHADRATAYVQNNMNTPN